MEHQLLCSHLGISSSADFHASADLHMTTDHPEALCSEGSQGKGWAQRNKAATANSGRSCRREGGNLSSLLKAS